MNTTKLLLGGVSVLGMLALAGCGEKQVGFNANAKPILNKYCMECHVPGGKGHEKTGLDMSTHEALMKGTRFGPVIKPGDSFTSAMIMLVEGRADPSIRMPHGKDPISKGEIDTLKKWIDQGAKNN